MRFIGVDLTSAFSRVPRLVDVAMLDDDKKVTVTVQSLPWPSNCGAGRPDRWATIARYR